MQKYELTDIKKQTPYGEVRRIRALKEFYDVQTGDLGGWVEGTHNLSQEDSCWVYHDAVVVGQSSVTEDACASEHATIFGNSKLSGNTVVRGGTRVGNSRLGADAYIDAILLDAVILKATVTLKGSIRMTGLCVKSPIRIHTPEEVRVELTHPQSFISIGPIGSENGFLTAYFTNKGIYCTRGCFCGTLKEFEEKVRYVHANTSSLRPYLNAIDLIRHQLS